MTSGYDAFTPGTRVRISPAYREHPGAGTVEPGVRASASGVLVRWDDGWIGTHDRGELVAVDPDGLAA